MKKANVHQHIVETASHLFYHKGYNLTGINEIIREADIAKATLYNHFRSKEDICLAYLNYKDEVFRQEIQAFVINEEAGENRVLGVFGFLRQFFEDEDFNGCWCLNTISELPKEDERIRKVIREQKQQLLQWMQSLVEDNISPVGEGQSAFMAQQLYLLYEAALSESYLHQASWPIDNARAFFKKLLSST